MLFHAHCTHSRISTSQPPTTTTTTSTVLVLMHAMVHDMNEHESTNSLDPLFDSYLHAYFALFVVSDIIKLKWILCKCLLVFYALHNNNECFKWLSILTLKPGHLFELYTGPGVDSLQPIIMKISHFIQWIIFTVQWIIFIWSIHSPVEIYLSSGWIISVHWTDPHIKLIHFIHSMCYYDLSNQLKLSTKQFFFKKIKRKKSQLEMRHRRNNFSMLLYGLSHFIVGWGHGILAYFIVNVSHLFME